MEEAKKQIVVNRIGSDAVSKARSICGGMTSFMYVATILTFIGACFSFEAVIFVIAASCLVTALVLQICEYALRGFYAVVYIKETEEAVNLKGYQTFATQKDLDDYNKEQSAKENKENQ